MLQDMDPAQKTELCLGLKCGRDTPKDQEDDHHEHDPDWKFRPQFIAKH